MNAFFDTVGGIVLVVGLGLAAVILAIGGAVYANGQVQLHKQNDCTSRGFEWTQNPGGNYDCSAPR